MWQRLSQKWFINVLLFIAILALTGCVAIAYLQIKALIKANAWVIHSHQVMERLSETALLLAEIDKDIDNYLLWNEGNRLQDLPSLSYTVNHTLLILSLLTVDNPTQQNHINLLSQFIQKKQQNWWSAYEQQPGIYVSLLINHDLYNKEINDLLKEMYLEELDRLTKRTMTVSQAGYRVNGVIFLIGTFGILLNLCSLILLNYYFRQRQLAEQKQKSAENILKVVIESSQDLIAAIDCQFNFLHFNGKYADKIKQLFNRSIAIGDNFIRLTNDDHFNNQFMEYWRRALQGETFKVVHEFKDKKNGVAYYDISFNPLYDQDQQMFGAAQSMHDITEYRKLEELKNEFISVVRKEFHAPLLAMRNSLNLILQGSFGEVNDKIKSLLLIIFKNSDRLGILINDVVDMELIESGEMVFDFKLVDLGKLLEEAVTIHQAYGDNVDVKVKYQKSNEVFYVQADYSRLMQVMANLLTNAIKFSPMGKQVEVMMARHDDKVRVSVIDHGQGIAKVHYKYIFKKLTQVEIPLARKKSGSGLGLRLCKAIIDKHNGHIGFTSQVDIGSTFYFELTIATPSL